MLQETIDIITKSRQFKRSTNSELFTNTRADILDIDCVFEIYSVPTYKNGRENLIEKIMIPVYWHIKAWTRDWLEVEIDSKVFNASDMKEIFNAV